MAKIWRMEDPVLDERGQVVVGGMWPHQRNWWQSEHFIKAMVAGYGSGKTFIGAKKAIALTLLNQEPHFWVSPSYKIAKRTSIPTLLELLEGKKRLDTTFKFKFNKADNEIRINHRGRRGKIWIGSGEEPDSLKGPNVGSATIDEPFIQSKEVFDQMLARVRSPRALRREIGLLGTPEQLNWGYDICEGDERDNYDIEVFNVSTEENKALPPEYVERLLRGYTDKMVEAFVKGHFVNLSRGTIYYGFSKDRNVVRLEDPGHELHVGMDFNVDPMAAVVFWRKGDHMHIVAELEIENADTEYMCSVLGQNHDRTDTSQFLRGQVRNFLNEDGSRRVDTVFPDASGRARATNAPAGQSDFTIIRGHGFGLLCKGSNPRVRDRENAVNGKFNPVKGRPTLTIDPDCKKLIQYLLGHTHELRLKQKQMTHLLDAMGYPVAYLYPINKPQVQISQIHGA